MLAIEKKKHATESLSLWLKSSKGTKMRKIQPGFYPCPGKGPSTILLFCVIFLFRVIAPGQGAQLCSPSTQEAKEREL